MSAVPSTPVTPAATAAHDLYERYRRRLFAFCLHRLGSREEAEDAVQSTFLNAFRSLQRGVEPQLEGAWLFRIAENVCYSRQRSSSRRRRLESTSDLQALQDVVPSRSGETDELFGLNEALGAMPAQQRRALLLREWQGLSYREISSELGLSQSAVETLLFRARRSLARGLEEPPAPVRPPRRGRLHAGELGSVLTVLKTLLFGGSAKVAVTVAAVAATSVAVSPPVRHEVEHVAAGGARMAEAAARPILYPAWKPASRATPSSGSSDRAPVRTATAVPTAAPPASKRTQAEPVALAAVPRVVREPLPTLSERHVVPPRDEQVRAAAAPAHRGHSRPSARSHGPTAKAAGEPKRAKEARPTKEHATRAAEPKAPKRHAQDAGGPRGKERRDDAGKAKAAAGTTALVETQGHERPAETAAPREKAEKSGAAKAAKRERDAVASTSPIAHVKHARAVKATGGEAPVGKAHAAKPHAAKARHATTAQRADRPQRADKHHRGDESRRNGRAGRDEQPPAPVEPQPESQPAEVAPALAAPEPLEAAPPEGDGRRS